MTRTRGRAPRGQRLIGTAPHGHWHTTTFLAGLRTTGFVAPLVLDGAISGETFLAYTQQFLVKELKPGDIVVLDNLSSHKVTGIREAINASSATQQNAPSRTYGIPSAACSNSSPHKSAPTTSGTAGLHS